MGRRLPPHVRRAARWLLPGADRRRRPRWGNLRSLRPFSDDFGWERGLPVDRVYIEGFLSQHADAIRGTCLEVLDDAFTRLHGAGAVTQIDVCDIDPTNLHANVIADLGEPGSLPLQRYDCVVLTQTAHLVPAATECLRNAYAALAPGGVLLLTVSTVSPHHPERDGDVWRLTPTGLAHLLEAALPAAAERTVEGYGNLVTATALLHGVVAAELKPREVAHHDPRYPVIAAARVRRPS